MNKRDIDSILNQLSKNTQYISYADAWVSQRFEQIKDDMIQEFESHLVTKEIDGGIGADNISDTLGGITNLYSFIGFYEGDKPLEPIREILREINMHKTVGRRSVIKYTFTFPTAKEIFKVTPIPWATGRSWAQGIEHGISGIGYFLRKYSERSYSGFGLQAKKPVRHNIRFKNTKYISDLLAKYTKRIILLEKETRL